MVKQKSSEPWKSSFRPKHQEKNIQPTYFSQKAAVTDVPFHKQYLPQHSWTTHTHTHKIIMLKSECVEINAELKKNKKNKNILGVSQKLELWVMKFWLVTGNISFFPQFYGNQISQVKNRVSFTCFVLLYKRHSKNMAVFLKCGMLVTVFSLNMWKYNI